MSDKLALPPETVAERWPTATATAAVGEPVREIDDDRDGDDE